MVVVSEDVAKQLQIVNHVLQVATVISSDYLIKQAIALSIESSKCEIDKVSTISSPSCVNFLQQHIILSLELSQLIFYLLDSQVSR